MIDNDDVLRDGATVSARRFKLDPEGGFHRFTRDCAKASDAPAANPKDEMMRTKTRVITH